ncbi:MAG: STAS domain-containing protein [Caldilineaceae bacterium]|nr:STAS domain-containing protein [Caldilineaceae bacterium]MCB0184428.1 STAS domain-containing protein [Caldilineaceae bacterium]
MELQVQSQNSVTILKIDGRLDSHTMTALRERIDGIVAKPTPRVVVDLTKVSFLDSSGLATLVYGMKNCREGGGDLCLSNPAQPVRLILELTRLDKAMEIYPTTVEAVASLIH